LEATIASAVAAWIEVGKRSRLRTSGQSMAPLLREGWMVLVEHGRENIRRGDVIAYRAGERVVVHRVVRFLADGGLLTKGDGRSGFDPPVVPAQIIGRVVSVITPWGSINLMAPWCRVGQSLLGWASHVAERMRALWSH